jgi:hypothetical protein
VTQDATKALLPNIVGKGLRGNLSDEAEQIRSVEDGGEVDPHTNPQGKGSRDKSYSEGRALF